MAERLGQPEFYPFEQKEIDALSPKNLSERVVGLKNLVRRRADSLSMTVFTSILSGGISSGLITAQQLDAISDSHWYLVPEILLGMAAAGGVIDFQEQRRKKKGIEEILEDKKRVANHPTAGVDETLARSVYDLDLRMSDDQITNLKKVLDTLRQQNLLVEHSNEASESSD